MPPERTVYERGSEWGLTPEARIRDLERELAEARQTLALAFRLIDALEKRARDAHYVWPKYLTKWLDRMATMREKYQPDKETLCPVGS